MEKDGKDLEKEDSEDDLAEFELESPPAEEETSTTGAPTIPPTTEGSETEEPNKQEL